MKTTKFKQSWIILFLLLICLASCREEERNKGVVYTDDTTYVSLYKLQRDGFKLLTSDTSNANPVTEELLNLLNRKIGRSGYGEHRLMYAVYTNEDGTVDKIMPLQKSDSEFDSKLLILICKNIRQKAKFGNKVVKYKTSDFISFNTRRNGEFNVNYIQNFPARYSSLKGINPEEYKQNMDELPSLPGGLTVISRKIKYPPLAKEKKIEGTIIIRSFINENGEVAAADILNGIGYGCEEEALNAIVNTIFRPGYINNHPVKSQMIIPLIFKLDNNSVELNKETSEVNKISMQDKISNTSVPDADYLIIADEMPEPIGGMEAIQQKLQYPEIPKRAGIEGKVYVLTYINERGNVDKTEVIRGLGAGLDEAAMSAIRQVKFTPGKNEGKPVKVKVTVPIIFKLQ